MTFLKGTRKRDILRRTKTITTLNKPSPIVLGLIAAVVVSVGFIAGLAILAPQQLAEAAITATDVICSGCVGTSDIADSAVTSAKIGSGQVGNSDIATNAVATAKISDTNGVYSVDIVNGQVKTEDLASGTIKPNIHQARGNEIILAPGGGGISRADCPSGEILTGGGYSTLYPVTVYQNFPQDENTWAVTGFNDGGTDNRNLVAIALCAGASP